MPIACKATTKEIEKRAYVPPTVETTKTRFEQLFVKFEEPKKAQEKLGAESGTQAKRSMGEFYQVSGLVSGGQFKHVPSCQKEEATSLRGRAVRS